MTAAASAAATSLSPGLCGAIAVLAALRVCLPASSWDAAGLLWLFCLLALLLVLLVQRMRNRRAGGVAAWPKPGVIGWCAGAAWLALAIAVVRRDDATHSGLDLAMGWAGVLAMAWLLSQAGSRTACAAGLGGLAGLTLLGLGQAGFTLPGMRALPDAEILDQAQRAFGATAPIDPESGQAAALIRDFRERVDKGGIYGPFTIANALAIVAVAWVTGLAAAAWTARRSTTGLATGLALLTGALALTWLSGSKGAWLCLGGGLAWAWCRHGPGLWRWAGLLPMAAGVLVLLIPAWRAPLQASIDVRLDYWRSASHLIAEAPIAGHGFAAYAEEAARVAAPGAATARAVHNEILEAAVFGGLPAAAIIAALLLACCWPWRGMGRSRLDAGGPGSRDPALGGAALVLAAAGALMLSLTADAGVAWWPGVRAGGWGVAVLWSAAVIAATVAAIRLGGSLGPLPCWAATAGATAIALGCLIDFHLHEPGLGMALAALLIGAAGKTAGDTHA